MSKTVVAGVGMVPFAKPGANAPYPEMAAAAVRAALADAGLDYGQIGQAYAGYVYVDARVQRIYGGANEVMKDLISRAL